MTWWVWLIIGIIGGIAAITTIALITRHQVVTSPDKADIWLVNEFSRCNVLVFGKKRQGKDLIFAHVIALRGKKHYANIPYDENTEVITLDELNVGDNTFEDFINGTVRPFSPRFDEGCDVYVSDGGIYLPCHFNKELNNRYPSMPIFFALSGQLYDMNVHLNTQALGRPWDKLREQADSYIQVLRTIPRGEYLYTKIVGYDKYENALNETNLTVKFTVRIPVAELTYDTRYFREFLFDSPPKVRNKILSVLSR